MFICSCNGLIYSFSAPIQQFNIFSIECYKFFPFRDGSFSLSLSLPAIGNSFSRVWMEKFSASLILSWHRFHKYGRSLSHTRSTPWKMNSQFTAFNYVFLYVYRNENEPTIAYNNRWFLLCIRVSTLRNGAMLHCLWTQPIETMCHVFGVLQVNRVSVEASN